MQSGHAQRRPQLQTPGAAATRVWSGCRCCSLWRRPPLLQQANGRQLPPSGACYRRKATQSQKYLLPKSPQPGMTAKVSSSTYLSISDVMTFIWGNLGGWVWIHTCSLRCFHLGRGWGGRILLGTSVPAALFNSKQPKQHPAAARHSLPAAELENALWRRDDAQQEDLVL